MQNGCLKLPELGEGSRRRSVKEFDEVGPATEEDRRQTRIMVKLYLSDGRAHGRTRLIVRCSLFQGRPSYLVTNRDASYKFRKGIQIRDQPINTRNLVSLLQEIH